MKFIVETSARHVHVTQEDLETLFGKGYELTKKKDLSQPGQFASNEKVKIVGSKKELTASILGPVRPETQIELSLTDARSIGVVAPIRESGDVAGSGACKLVGPAGEVEVKEGVIENLFKIATADGQFGAEELKLIKEIAKAIELPEGNFTVIRQAYEPKIATESSVADFYDVLGVLRTASDNEIKSKWKELINIYHPDRIQAGGATVEEVEKATLKMAEINNAYQNIMKSRKVA